jgi:hypothetical protein
MQCLGQVTKLYAVYCRFHKRLSVEVKLEIRNHRTLWVENRSQIIGLPTIHLDLFSDNGLVLG